MQKNLKFASLTCAGCTGMLLVTSGIVMNVFSAAQPYILAQNGFTNTQTSLIITVRSAVYLLCMLLIERYYARMGYRTGCALACMLAAGSFVLFAEARSLAAYYLAGAAAGISCGLGSMVPVSILMARWFHAHRGLALGICASGTGLATVVFSPILTRLIETAGLNRAFYVTAVFCAVMGAAVFAMIRSEPAACGLVPYGQAREMAARRGAMREVQLTKARWAAVLLAVLLVSGVCSTGFTHIMVLYVTAGMDTMHAAAALSVCGLALMAGKCVLGELCDRLGSYRANYLLFGVLLAGCGLCVLAPMKSILCMYLAAVLVGFGASLNTVGISMWAADLSEPERYARTMRLFQSAYGIGGILVSFIPGILADAAGGYSPAYGLFGGLMLGCLIVIQSAYRRTEQNVGQR